MWPFPAFAGATLALVIERLFGYPKPIQDAIGHPVEWIGRLISRLDTALNRPEANQSEGRLRGVIAMTALLVCAFVPVWLIAVGLARSQLGWLLEPLLASAFLAQTSLRQHVEAVQRDLSISLEGGRKAVSHIVGRDPSRLDHSDVVRAALESLAENASDGIVAPAIWYALLGLPGLVLYKAINTADSMIGHKSARYLHFGWAAARLDDLVNLPASRMSGALFTAAAWWQAPDRGRAAWQAMWRDARKHLSPNAGWPESALAGALGLRLGGPRSYGGRNVDLAWMGDGRSHLTPADIGEGLRLYARALSLLLVLMVALAVVL